MRFGPAVRLLVHQYGLNPSSIRATGPHGTLMKSDVLAVISSGALKPTPVVPIAPKSSTPSPTGKAGQQKPGLTPGASPFFDFSFSDVQKQFGSSLAQAKFEAPHAYQTAEINLSRVDSLLKSLSNKQSPPNFVHFLRVGSLLKATARALGKLKISTIDGSPLNAGDIAVAFKQSDGSQSTVTLQRAAAFNIIEVANFLQANGQSSTASASNASVSFHFSSSPETNVVRRFASVIRSPQVIAVSVTQQPMALIQNETDKKIRLAPVFSVTLSYDCSKVDDANAAALLHSISESIAAPGL